LDHSTPKKIDPAPAHTRVPAMLHPCHPITPFTPKKLGRNFYLVLWSRPPLHGLAHTHHTHTAAAGQPRSVAKPPAEYIELTSSRILLIHAYNTNTWRTAFISWIQRLPAQWRTSRNCRTSTRTAASNASTTRSPLTGCRCVCAATAVCGSSYPRTYLALLEKQLQTRTRERQEMQTQKHKSDMLIELQTDKLVQMRDKLQSLSTPVKSAWEKQLDNSVESMGEEIHQLKVQLRDREETMAKQRAHSQHETTFIKHSQG